ncbi:MAG: response regulator [Candidatus Hydrogenedentes bacterium]|nr:response regulator [Candidatus Hydrogenedentota bacterium]
MKKLRLLVVDDEESIRIALSRWFESSGFDVDLAEDGLVAVEKCQANEYDAVTMDLEMPRMRGAEAVQHIRRLWPNLPVIVLTAHAEAHQEAADLDVSCVLAKPTSLNDLEREVRTAIGA